MRLGFLGQNNRQVRRFLGPNMRRDLRLGFLGPKIRQERRFLGPNIYS